MSLGVGAAPDLLLAGERRLRTLSPPGLDFRLAHAGSDGNP